MRSKMSLYRDSVKGRSSIVMGAQSSSLIESEHPPSIVSEERTIWSEEYPMVLDDELPRTNLQDRQRPSLIGPEPRCRPLTPKDCRRFLDGKETPDSSYGDYVICEASACTGTGELVPKTKHNPEDNRDECGSCIEIPTPERSESDVESNMSEASVTLNV